MNKPTATSPGLLRTLRTVGSAMFGVRGRKRHEEDAAALSPLLVAIAALIFMAVFVGVLVTLATTIVGK
ncbi:MAG: DUF2970 domain-containing protein [Pseudomonadota bacterium]|uniref:DUF2970 domain-containing protein n=1 Tax=Sulfuritalea sp. TaxID=2480090 RepID=UPI00286E3926|nr:DUF2970 domain-containing protein [Sulfuritalea sp.]